MFLYLFVATSFDPKTTADQVHIYTACLRRDPSGQELFRTLTFHYMRGAMLIVVVYDVTGECAVAYWSMTSCIRANIFQLIRLLV
jgi:hypothetical protein